MEHGVVWDERRWLALISLELQDMEELTASMALIVGDLPSCYCLEALH